MNTGDLDILVMMGSNLFTILTAIEMYNLFKKKKNYIKSIHHLCINVINLFILK
jgi:hypothetical protein